MRQVVFAAALAAWLARPVLAQTPETPEPQQKHDGPYGVPVDPPNKVDGPYGVPVKPPEKHDGPYGVPVEPPHDGPYGVPVQPDKPAEQKPDKPAEQKPDKPAEQKPDAPAAPTPAPAPGSGSGPGPAPGPAPARGSGSTPAPGAPTKGPAAPSPSPAAPSPSPAAPSPSPTAPSPSPSSPSPSPTAPTPAPGALPAPAQKPAAPPIAPEVKSEYKPLQNADIPASGAEIKKIVVEENEKTTSETVALISQLEVGDTWTADMVDVVKMRLVSSGLFKDVEVYWTREGSGVAVHILAKDKHSWVIAPAFYNQPTNKGFGVGYGENNLGGKNQKLLLYGQIATGDSFFIGAWVVPAIGGTRFYSQLDTYLKTSRNIEYSTPRSYLIDGEGPDAVRPVRESRIHYLNFGGKLGVDLFHGIKLDARLRGAKVAYKDIKLAEGATVDDIMPGADPMNLPKPGAEGWDISNEIALTIDRRANWYGVQTGYKYHFSFEHALESLGSDFSYWYATADVFKAYQVLERHNLVLKSQVAYGRDLPFQQEFTTGGTSMRGWLNNEFRGDFRVTGNLEYSVPVFTIAGFGVRALTFFDTAYTTFLRTSNPQRNYLPNSQVRGLDGFKNSVGVGTRFYLRQIVLPLLGLDFGYGLEARDFQVYLAIGLTD